MYTATTYTMTCHTNLRTVSHLLAMFMQAVDVERGGHEPAKAGLASVRDIVVSEPFSNPPASRFLTLQPVAARLAVV